MNDRKKTKLLVLYGTISGNAKCAAETIFSEMEVFDFKERNIMEMDSYDKYKLIDEEIVIFVCSAIGNGREPDNMKNFWKFLLRKQLPNDILSSLNIAVFGLGDSKYRGYNFPSKKLYKRLLQLGANPITERGEGDAQNKSGYKSTLFPWIEKLKTSMEVKKLVSLNPYYSAKLKYSIEYQDYMALDKSNEALKNCLGKEEYEVVSNKRVTPDNYFKDVHFIELKKTDDDTRYEPGEIINITPTNLSSEIDEIVENMGWTDIADKPFTIKSNNIYIEIPENWKSVQTLRKLLVNSLDILGIPNIIFMNSLYKIVDNELSEQDKEDFSNNESLLNRFIKGKYSIYDILLKYNCSALRNVNIENLLDMIPIIEPRSYSIASSQSSGNQNMQLIVGVIEHKTENNIIRKGICTKWLSSLCSSDKVLLNREKGAMELPKKAETPLIMICTGTGIATMRSFIQERVSLNQKENYLFYGYRNSNCDDFFIDEFKKYQSEGLLKIYPAISRDQDKKIYVQNRLEENSKLIWELIHEKKALIYVSGNAETIPMEVENVLCNIFSEEGNLSSFEAQAYLKDLQLCGNYQEECY